MDKDLKSLMADVAESKLSYALIRDAGDEKGDEAFKQGITAFNAYTELTKVDDSRDEELTKQDLEIEKLKFEKEKQEFEKEKLEREEELKKAEIKNSRIMTAIQVGATAVVAPVVMFICNKKLTKYIGTIEQMETFTSTAGRSLGKMFKFGK